jgi:hypothetical protein
MVYIQAAQGLSERAEATLISDALVVVPAIDDWNAQRLSSLQTVAGLPSVARLFAGEPDPMLVPDHGTAAESLAALDAPWRGGRIGRGDQRSRYRAAEYSAR